MADKSYSSKGARQLLASAENGNLLSRFELYQDSQSGKHDPDISEEQAQQQLAELKSAAQSSCLRIESLALYSFRRYTRLHLDFNNQLTVIVGENGAGKTSIVESIARLLGWLGSRFVKANNSGSRLTDSDINVKATDYAQTAATFTLNDATRLELSLIRPVSGWAGEANSELQGATVLGSMYRLLAEKNTQQVLPVLAYYPVERSFMPVPAAVYESRLQPASSSRFDAYKDVFRPDAKAMRIVEAYIELDNRAQASSQHSAHRQHLALVEQAIENAVPHIKNLHVDRSSGKAELKLDNFGNCINFAQLSQGQKILAGMIGDLALRMIQLNPQLKNPLAAPGIVVIDEIDLHLHPRLQQKIIPALQSTFTGVQWIITTHSPHVLSTVDKNSIRMLSFFNDETSVIPPEFQTKGVMSSDVLEQIMGTHAVPELEESGWVTQYQALIQENQWHTAQGKSLRKKIVRHFGEQHPITQDLNGQIRLAELKQKFSSKKDSSHA